MKCPVCETVDLLLSERQGVEIDYCPQCRGVWLDRSELDKIIERSMQQSGPTPRANTSPDTLRKRKNDEPEYYYDDDYDDDRYRGRDSRGKPYRKKSVLGEIFDIFD